MNKKTISHILEIGCSGLIGVIITIGYQHISSSNPSFTFIHNGEEMIVTESSYTDIMEENNSLKIENEKLKQEYDALNELYITTNKQAEQLNNQIAELQSQSNDSLEELKQQYENEISSKYDVDFQNINLIINGIDTKYNNKVANIDGEEYFSMGFLQYLVDNEKISDNNKKLFIGDIQSEEQMAVSLFDFGNPFTKGYLVRTTDEGDNFEDFDEPAFKLMSSTSSYDDLKGKTEYFIDKKFSRFCFDVAYSKNADQRYNYEIVIYGDNKQLKSIVVDRKTKRQSFEIDVTGVEFLQIVGKGVTYVYNDHYSLMLAPYLYP